MPESESSRNRLDNSIFARNTSHQEADIVELAREMKMK
jgi:hypothetical protein